MTLNASTQRDHQSERPPFKGYPVVPHPVVSYPSLSQFLPEPMIHSYLTFTLPNYKKHLPRE